MAGEAFGLDPKMVDMFARKVGVDHDLAEHMIEKQVEPQLAAERARAAR